MPAPCRDFLELFFKLLLLECKLGSISVVFLNRSSVKKMEEEIYGKFLFLESITAVS